MSRLAKKPIAIPEGVDVTLGQAAMTVKGPAGVLTRMLPSVISVVQKDRTLEVTPRNAALTTRMLLGTTVAHLRNMIKGSQSPFVKKLIIEGVGFKAEVKGKELVCSLGFSHQVKVPIPDDLKVTSEKGVITVAGTDIEAVGAFAAGLRAQKKPEPYKGKGIRYETEVIRRKQGKKTT